MDQREQITVISRVSSRSLGELDEHWRCGVELKCE